MLNNLRQMISSASSAITWCLKVHMGMNESFTFSKAFITVSTLLTYFGKYKIGKVWQLTDEVSHLLRRMFGCFVN